MAMNIETLKALDKFAPKAFDAIEHFIKTGEGFVEDCVPVKIGDKTGFLVWDYVLYNEIRFVDDNGNERTFFTGLSDEETRKRFDKYSSEYKI